MKTLLSPLASLSSIVLLLLSISANANASLVGQEIPSITIKDKGELMLNPGDKFSYVQWSTEELKGKVTMLQYLGANIKSNKLNQHFQDAYDAAAQNFDLKQHQSITILNLKDAMWGTSGFVTSELKSNKKKHPYARLVADKNGVGQQVWSLKKNSYAVAVTDRNGKVLFFKDGKLTEDEVNTVIEIIQKNL